MMFFSNEFATTVNNGATNDQGASSKGASSRKGSDRMDSRDDSDRKDKEDEGRWDMLTDAYGRLCTQHSVTGQWGFVYGGSVSPIAAAHASPFIHPGGVVFTPPPPLAPMVNPSPLVYPGGAAAFASSPVHPVASAKRNEKGKNYRNGGKKKNENKKIEEDTKKDEEGKKKNEKKKIEEDTKKDEEGKKKNENKKMKEGKGPKSFRGRGWWETMYNEEGVRYWKHTVTQKTTYKDPYF